MSASTHVSLQVHTYEEIVPTRSYVPHSRTFATAYSVVTHTATVTQDTAGGEQTLYTKCPRYAGKTLPQAKVGRFDFLKTIKKRKCMKCPRTFSLLRAKVLNLVNKQSTILCVLRQQIFIIQCEF